MRACVSRDELLTPYSEWLLLWLLEIPTWLRTDNVEENNNAAVNSRHSTGCTSTINKPEHVNYSQCVALIKNNGQKSDDFDRIHLNRWLLCESVMAGVESQQRKSVKSVPKRSVENYPQHPQKRIKVLWGCDGAQIKRNNLNSSCSNFARIWTESEKHLLSFWNRLIFGKPLPHSRSTSHFCQEVKFSQKLTISALCTEMLSSSRITKEHYSIPNTGFITRTLSEQNR